MHEILEKVFSKLTATCHSIFIAGGAAVDVERAGDIDLWFGNNNKEAAEKYLKGFVAYELLAGTPYGAIGEEGGLLIGNGFDPSIGKVVQVLTTPHTLAEKCIGTFDISTHMFAFTSRGVCVIGAQATNYLQPPKILRNNPRTFSRYVKICQRYGHPIDVEVLKKCSEKVNGMYEGIGVDILPAPSTLNIGASYIGNGNLQTTMTYAPPDDSWLTMKGKLHKAEVIAKQKAAMKQAIMEAKAQQAAKAYAKQDLSFDNDIPF